MQKSSMLARHYSGITEFQILTSLSQKLKKKKVDISPEVDLHTMHAHIVLHTLTHKINKQTSPFCGSSLARERSPIPEEFRFVVI